jgi:adenine-specific DNA-methyltransferase
MLAAFNEITLPNKVGLWNEYKTRIVDLKKSCVKLDNEEDLTLAHTFCYNVVKSLWNIIDTKKMFKVRKYSKSFSVVNIDYVNLAKEIAQYLSTLSIVECGYYIGVMYTLLLPNDYKSKLGIYYTPPVLTERLLDTLAAEGINWSKDKILDPACGGGAFLIPIANRILGDHRIKCLSAKERLNHLETHIKGMEIDPFAGWITQVLLDIITYQESAITGKRFKNVVKITDTIKTALAIKDKYDLVVGNPPYGKITLCNDLREAYSRSLFGHANMYGLFIDAALRLKKKNGMIGFVTPTSFLGGEYFKNLRTVLSKDSPLVSIDFISARAGVFDEVLQETCLAVFGNNPTKEICIHDIDVSNSEYKVNRVGMIKLNNESSPWIIPRRNSEIYLINVLNKANATLKDYGYKASTGPLVWNRHKDQLIENIEDNIHPIIWSEAISDGKFTFDYKIRKNKYIKLKEKQDFLLCKEPVVLVQRTTSKEQSKRILTAVMPKDYIDKWNGAVVENHVNILYPIGEPRISLEALSLIMNTKIVDSIFRCISGSVAVSVAELHALPLPNYENIKELDMLLSNSVNKNLDMPDLMEMVEKIVTKAYGVGE